MRRRSSYSHLLFALVCNLSSVTETVLLLESPYRAFAGQGTVRIRGPDAVLLCNFPDNIRIVSNVIWERDGRWPETRNNRIYHHNSNQSAALLLRNYGPQDWDNYRCLATALLMVSLDRESVTRITSTSPSSIITPAAIRLRSQSIHVDPLRAHLSITSSDDNTRRKKRESAIIPEAGPIMRTVYQSVHFGL